MDLERVVRPCVCACLRSLEPVGGSNVQLCPRARWALGREGGRPRVRAGAAAAVASFTKVSKTSEVARLGVVPGPAPVPYSNNKYSAIAANAENGDGCGGARSTAWRANPAV